EGAMHALYTRTSDTLAHLDAPRAHVDALRAHLGAAPPSGHTESSHNKIARASCLPFLIYVYTAPGLTRHGDLVSWQRKQRSLRRRKAARRRLPRRSKLF